MARVDVEHGVVARTPNREHGELETEGIVLDSTGASADPGSLRYDGTDFAFRDATGLFNPRTGGSGLTETQHRALRQLIHFIDEGPAEGFVSGAFHETLPSADPFPTSFIWWTSAAKTHKIVELTLTLNANKTPATEEWKMYDTDGTTVLTTVTDTISYSGIFETTRTRAIV